MSDEVTRQMREARQDAVEAFGRAFENLKNVGVMLPKEPTLTERIDEHCRLVAMAEESVKSPVSQPCEDRMKACKRSYWDAQSKDIAITAINEFRACKQDPAFSAWATKWAVRLCRALGAE